MTSPPTFTPWKGGKRIGRLSFNGGESFFFVGNFGAQMSGAFTMFRNQHRFCESIPRISNGRKKTPSSWVFLKGLPSSPNGPTFQCLTCLICLWPMDRKGRSKTNLVDLDGISRNSTSNHCFLKVTKLLALRSPLFQRISPQISRY